MSLLLPPAARRSDDEDAVALHLVQLAEDLVRAVDVHARGRFGLSGARLAILLALAQAEPAGLRPAELAERLRVSRATVSRLLDGLAGDALVARGPDPGDRRARRVRLTRRGRARAREVAPAHATRLAALVRALDHEERAQLVVLLEKLRAGLRALHSP